MSDTASHGLPGQSRRNFFQQLELDTRLLGMVGAFIVLAIVLMSKRAYIVQ